jgi:hypothetical protein
MLFVIEEIFLRDTATIFVPVLQVNVDGQFFAPNFPGISISIILQFNDSGDAFASR